VIGERQREIYRQERPRLPVVVKRPCRNEQQRRHHKNKEQEPAERLLVQDIHGAMLARIQARPIASQNRETAATASSAYIYIYVIYFRCAPLTFGAISAVVGVVILASFIKVGSGH
jgi:hypothetical protein